VVAGEVVVAAVGAATTEARRATPQASAPGRRDLDDRELAGAPDPIGQAHLQPAGDAAGQRRDDHLVVFIGVQGVAHRGEGIGIADDRSLEGHAAEAHSVHGRFGPLHRLRPAGAHVGRPGQPVRDRGHKEREAGRRLELPPAQRRDQLGRVGRAVGYDKDFLGDGHWRPPLDRLVAREHLPGR
jgi:hypothetical protein